MLDDNDDERELIEGLRNGNQQACEHLVRRYGGRLFATAQRYLRSEAEASDAVQDAFLRAFKSIHTFNGDCQLSIWLHRVVVDSALMRLRTMRRSPATTSLDIDELLPRFDNNGNWIESSRLSAPAERGLEASERKAIVRECIGLLPNNYRSVLILRDVEKLDTEQTASVLNLTLSTVKVRLHRARQALKALLERYTDFRSR